jgi:hypothetical protein
MNPMASLRPATILKLRAFRKDLPSVSKQTFASRLAGDGLAQRRLRRGQPRDRHAIGRA